MEKRQQRYLIGPPYTNILNSLLIYMIPFHAPNNDLTYVVSRLTNHEERFREDCLELVV